MAELPNESETVWLCQVYIMPDIMESHHRILILIACAYNTVESNFAVWSKRSTKPICDEKRKIT